MLSQLPGRRRWICRLAALLTLGAFAPAAQAEPSPDAGALPNVAATALPTDGGPASPSPPTAGGPTATAPLTDAGPPPIDALPPAPTPPPVAAPVTVPFSGRVRQKGERTPIAGASVLFDGGEPATVTDAEGRFAFAAVAVGRHKVRVRAAQVVPADTDETLEPGKALEVTYYVDVKRKYETTVRGARLVKETVAHVLAGDEIKRIPGTQGDLIRAVESMPGVARSGFASGGLIVWGSAPEDTRVYVDGSQIPTIFHFGGLRSTVNSEVVQTLTFLPGGYGVEYGRGLGGVVDVTIRRPRSDGYHGFVQIDLIDGSFLVEGPITKTLSFGLSLRRSWIDLFLPLITPNEFQISPQYTDYQARLSWRATPRDTFDLFVFGTDDTLSLIAKNPDPLLAAQIATHTFFHRLVGRYTHKFADGSQVAITPSASFDSPFKFTGNFGGFSFNLDTSRWQYDLRAVARIVISPMLRLDVGFDFEGNAWSIRADSSSGGFGGGAGGGGGFSTAFRSAAASIYQNDFAPFLSIVYQLFDGQLMINPQLRLDLFSFTGRSNFDPTAGESTSQSLDRPHLNMQPRLLLRWEPRRWLAIKGAIGLYNQPPDPSNLFAPFGDASVRPETAIHGVFGLEFRPTGSLLIQADGFYKHLTDLIVPRAVSYGPAQVNEGVGRVYGAQLLVKQELWKGLFAWVSYTLSRSERRPHPGDAWRLFEFDQTHILTVIGSWQFGRGYQIGARFRLISGNPTTPFVSSYFDANYTDFALLQGRPLSDRLPPFHQLDLRFDKKWTFKLWAIAIYLDIQNIYNARNAEAYQYSYDLRQPRQPVAGIPFLPVFGIRGDY